MKVLITAGRTVESIDPVRYISNRSSGKLALALAQAFLENGSRVKMICGVTDTAIPKNFILTRGETARAMRASVLRHAENYDIVILAAAVSDYEPLRRHPLKLPKSQETFSLRLRPTPDIAKELGSRKKKSGKPRLLVGFALESDRLIPKALKKLKEKNLDLIIANHVQTAGSNQMRQSCIIDRSGKVFKLKRVVDKNKAAKIITEKILNAYFNQHSK